MATERTPCAYALLPQEGIMPKVWTPHVLLAWGGELGNPAVDIWTNTLKLIPYLDGVQITWTEDQQFEYVTAAQVYIKAFVSSGSSNLGTAAKLAWVKCNSIGADGKYIYPNTTVFDVSPVVTGAGGPANWRVSQAVTLRTGLSRGRAHTGRFYPPCSTYVPAQDLPYITTANASALATAAKALLDGLQAIEMTDGSQAKIVCVSPGLTDVGVEPVFNLVTAVEVDRVPDTQKRRTNRAARATVEQNLA